MISAIEKQQNGNIKLTITIPWAEITKVKEEVIKELIEHTELPGFRKGKAPKKLVEKSLSKEKVNEEILRKVLPKGYVEAIKEHKISPVISPRIQVEKIEEEKDWQFSAVTCETPKVDLGNYKESVKKITAKSKIVIPGKEQTPPSLDEIIAELLKSVKITIPQVITESETERLLSQTLDEIKKLGLTLDQYLASSGKTAETLRQEYQLKAENDIKLEFTLREIAETEKITVDEKEVDEAINQAKTNEEKQSLQSNKYLLASILRQQKTLDFLKNL